MSKKTKKNSSKGKKSSQTLTFDAGTQTENDFEKEIQSYQLKIDLLQKEILEYKKRLPPSTEESTSNEFKTPKKSETAIKSYIESNTLVGSSNKIKKGCNCKSNCSNSKCGCVKKGFSCEENCKCNISKCCNQDSNKENITEQVVLSKDDLSTLEKLDNLSLDQETSHVTDRKAKRDILNVIKLPNSDKNNPASTSLCENKKRLYSQHSEELVDISVNEEIEQNESIHESEKVFKHTSVNNNSVGMIENNLITNIDIPETISSNINSPREIISTTVFETPRFVSKRKYKKKISSSGTSDVLTIESNKNNPNTDLCKIEIETMFLNPMIPKRQLPRSPVSLNSSSSNLETHMDSNFDPMKPKRELPRSPVNSNVINCNSEIGMETSIHPMMPKRQLLRSPINVYGNLITTPTKRFSPPPKKELEMEKVDWDRHQSELVQCKCCKRKFFPHRIQKHVAHCLGL